jgi:PhzF family phenazine biosynthesis protein
MDLPVRLLNVFSLENDPFSGNPLAVFEEAAALPDHEMQAWARQLGLSETTFVTAEWAGGDGRCGADVRIFTATYEMPFAGHPTLGTAHVVAARHAEATGAPVDEVALTMPAGTIPVRRTDDGWQLSANAPRHREVEVAPDDLAAAVGLDVDQLVDGAAQWVDVGVEQLIVQLADVESVRACAPDVARMRRHLASPGRPPHVYVWAWTGPDTVEARLFAVSGTTVEEDPATGSACSNLGGWLVGRGTRDLRVTVSQGAAVGRPSRLVLTVDADGGIHVSGRVTEVGVAVMTGT